MVCNPFCCTSIRDGAKRLAVIDIILFFLTVIVATGLEWSLFKSIPMRLVLFDDGVTSAESFEEMTIPDENNDKHMIGIAVWNHAFSIIKSASEYNTGLGYLLYVGMLITMMGYFILEIWLCCVLIRAASERRPQFAKKWLIYRTILLILTLAMTAINLFQWQYTVTDIVVQPLNILRLYSIFAVIQLRKKLIKTDPKLMF